MGWVVFFGGLSGGVSCVAKKSNPALERKGKSTSGLVRIGPHSRAAGLGMRFFLVGWAKLVERALALIT